MFFLNLQFVKFHEFDDFFIIRKIRLSLRLLGLKRKKPYQLSLYFVSAFISAFDCFGLMVCGKP